MAAHALHRVVPAMRVPERTHRALGLYGAFVKSPEGRLVREPARSSWTIAALE
jgi:hypothetical protein